MSITNNIDDPDGRTSARRKMLLKGTIVYNRGTSTMDCAVYDLSDAGARLRPIEIGLLPDRFVLNVRAGGTYQCEMVHRYRDQIGVRFVDQAVE